MSRNDETLRKRLLREIESPGVLAEATRISLRMGADWPALWGKLVVFQWSMRFDIPGEAMPYDRAHDVSLDYKIRVRKPENQKRWRLAVRAVYDFGGCMVQAQNNVHFWGRPVSGELWEGSTFFCGASQQTNTRKLRPLSRIHAVRMMPTPSVRRRFDRKKRRRFLRCETNFCNRCLVALADPGKWLADPSGGLAIDIDVPDPPLLKG